MLTRGIPSRDTCQVRLIPRPSRREIYGPAEPDEVVKILNRSRSEGGFELLDKERVMLALAHNAPRKEALPGRGGGLTPLPELRSPWG